MSAKLRLLQLIKQKYPHLSQKQIKNYIAAGMVRLNGKSAQIHDWPVEHDHVEIDREILFGQLAADDSVNCEILQITPDYYFLKKGCGVHSIALDFMETNSVANWLLSLNEAQRNVSSPLESGLLHRLDFETSGVMVAARNKAAYIWLRKCFENQEVYKEYVCLTSKAPESLGWETAYAQNHPRSKKKILITSECNLKLQSEKIRMKILDQKKYRKGYFLRIQLVTGYRHQIRAQLAFLGCPLLGDPIYGGIKADRLMLHARAIKFQGRRGEKYQIECDASF